MDILDIKKAQKYTDKQVDKLRLTTAKRIENLETKAKALEGLNPNQEAKQTVTGYDIVSLPKSAANGHMGVGLKGLTATNLIQNGNFADGTMGWSAGASTITVKNHILSHTSSGTSTYPSVWTTTTNRFQMMKDHKLYIRRTCRVTYDECVQMLSYFSDNDVPISAPTIKTPEKDAWYTTSGIVLVPEEYDGQSPALYMSHGQSTPTTGATMEVKEVLVIDLTATFGADNEPTKEECDIMFANYFDNTQHTAGSVRVKSVGKNLVDYPYEDTTKTSNGISFTDNGDGSITVSGTATAVTNLPERL